MGSSFVLFSFFIKIGQNKVFFNLLDSELAILD